MSCFDPQALIAELPPFDATATMTPSMEAFCRFYGIDFRARHCRQQLGQIDAGGYRIAIHRFSPRTPRGTLVLVHGYHDHHALYGHLISYLLKRDLNVLCFDLPGHGLSSGIRGSIANFEHYQQVLQQVLSGPTATSQPLHLLGQSTGAAIINQHLLQNQPTLEGQVIQLAPLVRPARWPLVRMSHQLLSPWIRAVPRQFTDNSNDPAFLSFLRNRDPLQCRTIEVQWVTAFKHWLGLFLTLPPHEGYAPLIIQGQQDATVDWRYNLRVLRQKFPNSETLLLADARHHLANESESIRRHYLHWLDRHWPALPNVSDSFSEASSAVPGS